MSRSDKNELEYNFTICMSDMVERPERGRRNSNLSEKMRV